MMKTTTKTKFHEVAFKVTMPVRTCAELLDSMHENMDFAMEATLQAQLEVRIAYMREEIARNLMIPMADVTFAEETEVKVSL